ncbi:MAG: tetratricopeptide repeat protein [Polyangia bacterium]|jgi:tetratricopeptide (TPR) repeat protein|nr:tetratricopeptide repeat protein [Polyangia bacterium]
MEEVFSTKDVSRLFGLSESRIRYWAQTGFIGPSARRGNRRLYSFSDLIGIKVARDLLESGLSLQRVRKNLVALRSLLPEEERPLSRLRVLSDGDRMWVHAEDATFDAASGQLLLSLSTGELEDDVVRILDLARPPRQSATPAQPEKKPVADRHAHRSAYRWFLEGLARDDDPATLGVAMDAYRRALELDPSLAAAHTNLGRAEYQRGNTAKARAHFERALALDPAQAEARYNLANLYDEEGEEELALAELRRVVASNPDFADAHFNLGVILERLGSRVQASASFRRFIELAGEKDSLWGRLASGHLEQLEEAGQGSADQVGAGESGGGATAARTAQGRKASQGGGRAAGEPSDLPDEPPF